MDRRGGEARPAGEVFSLNIDDLDVDELERRLEMAVANAEVNPCVAHCACHIDCTCSALTSCGAFCESC